MKTSKLLIAAAAVLTVVASPVRAAEPGTWTLRAGVGMVSPQSNNLVFSDGTNTLQVNVDDGTAVTLSATYFFTENWAFDILGATPFSHHINATITDSVDPGFSGPVSLQIAETKHLPPTFSMQYHFVPDGTFQPYVGLGLNWTTFFDSKMHPDLVAAGIEDIDLDDSFGVAAQVAADWYLNDRWLINFDVRWANIETDATLSSTALGGSVDIGTVKIDPWVYAINVGYHFN